MSFKPHEANDLLKSISHVEVISVGNKLSLLDDCQVQQVSDCRHFYLRGHRNYIQTMTSVFIILCFHEVVSYLHYRLELAAYIFAQLDCELLQLAGVVGCIPALKKDTLIPQNQHLDVLIIIEHFL